MWQRAMTSGSGGGINGVYVQQLPLDSSYTNFMYVDCPFEAKYVCFRVGHSSSLYNHVFVEYNADESTSNIRQYYGSSSATIPNLYVDVQPNKVGIKSDSSGWGTIAYDVFIIG